MCDGERGPSDTRKTVLGFYLLTWFYLQSGNHCGLDLPVSRAATGVHVVVAYLVAAPGLESNYS